MTPDDLIALSVILGAVLAAVALGLIAHAAIARRRRRPTVAPDPKTYETLGDIADELRRMKDAGMTRASVEYALNRVYWEEAR